jgi:hypothetical protein
MAKKSLRTIARGLSVSISFGDTLKLASAMAQASSSDSPHGSLMEMQNCSTLLPEKPDSDPHHDVPVLLAISQLGRLLTPTRAKERAFFPNLPPCFTARQLDMFQVIKGLKY